jgi:hypothetical protein
MALRQALIDASAKVIQMARGFRKHEQHYDLCLLSIQRAALSGEETSLAALKMYDLVVLAPGDFSPAQQLTKSEAWSWGVDEMGGTDEAHYINLPK